MNTARTMAAAVAAAALLSAADVHAPHFSDTGRAYTRNLDGRGQPAGAIDGDSDASVRSRASHGTTVGGTDNSLAREPSQEGEDNALRNLAFHHALSPTSSDGRAASGVNIPFLSPASFSTLNGGLTAYGAAGGIPTENVGSTPGTDVWGGWTDPDDDGANTDPSSNADDIVIGPAKPLSLQVISDPLPLTPVALPEPDTAALTLICITALGCILRRGAMPRS